MEWTPVQHLDSDMRPWRHWRALGAGKTFYKLMPASPDGGWYVTRSTGHRGSTVMAAEAATLRAAREVAELDNRERMN